MNQTPAKLFYKIGEVSERTGVEAHTLRYWEQELPILQARKNRSGHRIYTAEDMAMIQNIRQLVQVEGLTLQGVQLRLSGKAQPIPPASGDCQEWRRQLRTIRQDLEEVRKLLAFPGPPH
jgi:DNA-binding transcriptional MerR regulator